MSEMRNYISNNKKLTQFVVLLGIFFSLCLLISPSDSNILWRFPPLIAGLPLLINDCVSYLMYEFMPIEIYDPEIEEYEERPLIKEVTRALSSAVLFCIQVIREILLGGVKTIVTFTSWDFVNENKWAYWPALPWTVVCSAAILLGYS